MEPNRYYRFEQGSYALLKRIPSKYMKSNQEYMIKRPLKGFMSKSFYHYLENNKQELVKLISHINSRLNIYLELKGKDKFYPDFILKLKTGKILVVEWKGDHLKNPDSLEKEHLG